MRTTIEIDNHLMELARQATGLATTRAIVHEALRLLVTMEAQRDLLGMAGDIATWDASDSDHMAESASARAWRRHEAMGELLAMEGQVEFFQGDDAENGPRATDPA